MPDLKNPKVAIPIVLFAGILWSFGPYVVRHIDQPETVPWQYLFARGIVIFLLLNVYLFLEEGISFIPSHGSQTQNIPPITSVKDSKVKSAAGMCLDPIE